MESFTEEITLVNAGDISAAQNGFIPDANIRTVTVEAMPDTGAWSLVINEAIRQNLGLRIKKTAKSTLADGKTDTYSITEGVEIHWKDRDTVLPALLVPDAKDVLLGALPLEAMDLLVDPVHKRLAGAHGDQPVHILYTLGKG